MVLENGEGLILLKQGMYRPKVPIAQEIRTRIDKWDCIRLKSFCTVKETNARVKRQSKGILCQLFA
jgi:hypothetical protein